MALVTVPVLKAFTDPAGVRHAVGDRVALEALEAARRAQRGEVSLTVGARPAPAKARRTYRRRDLVPE
jgi:hypothetical protein